MSIKEHGAVLWIGEPLFTMRQIVWDRLKHFSIGRDGQEGLTYLGEPKALFLCGFPAFKVDV